MPPKFDQVQKRKEENEENKKYKINKFYKDLEEKENKILNLCEMHNKHKDTVVMYSYDFSDFEINKIIHNYIKTAKHSPNAHSLIGIFNGLGQIALGNLFNFGGIYFLSLDYLKKYNTNVAVRHLRKIINHWLISRGNNIKKSANTYDFLGLYGPKKPRLIGKGVMVKPLKFQRLIHQFFDKYAKNNSIRHISFKKFQRDLQNIINECKINVKKAKVIYNKDYSAFIEANKHSSNSSKSADIFTPINSAINPLNEEFESFKRQTILIPFKNYKNFIAELESTKDLLDILVSNEDFEEMLSPETIGVQKKLRKLYRDFGLYQFDNPNVVTIKGKKYIKCHYNDKYSEKTGRNYHIIASTSKIGRKILFRDYFSIDVSNMAGKALFDVVSNFINEDEIPAFKEYANNRNSFFKKIEINLPETIKVSLLKQIFLSMIFGRDMRTIVKMLIQNKNPQFVRDFKESIKDLIFEISPNKVEEYTEIFLKDLVSLNNIYILDKFLYEIEKIADIIDRVYNNNFSIKNRKKELSAIFMLTESELIENILNKVNKYLKETKSVLKAYRIHDEIIVPKLDKNIIEIIIDGFSSKNISIKNKKVLVKAFKSSVTVLSTGKKLNFDDLNLKTLKESIVEDFNIYNVDINIKKYLHVEEIETLSLHKNKSYIISSTIFNKRVSKILDKTITSITEEDIKFLNSFIKNLETEKRKKLFFGLLKLYFNKDVISKILYAKFQNKNLYKISKMNFNEFYLNKIFKHFDKIIFNMIFPDKIPKIKMYKMLRYLKYKFDYQ